MAAAERRYARALFEAAQERNRLEEVQRDLSDFVDAVREVPELRALLRDPVLDRRVKIAALSDVLAGSDELVRNFVLVLTEQGRAGELEETEREFERFLADETGRLSLELATAIELSDEEAGQIVQQIERVEWAQRRGHPRASIPTCSEASSSRSDRCVSTPVSAAAWSGCAVNSHLPKERP